MSHEQRPGSCRDIEDNAEEQHFLESETERFGGVDSAEREDGYQTVVVHEARNQETHDLAVSANLCKRIAQLTGRIAEHAPAPRDGGPVLGDPEQERQREHREPHRHQQVGGANILAGLRTETEPGSGWLNQRHQRQHQSQQAAGVSQRPSLTGDPPDASARRYIREKGIVEDSRELIADIGNHDEYQCGGDLTGQDQVERSGRRRANQRKQQHEGFATTAAVHYRPSRGEQTATISAVIVIARDQYAVPAMGSGAMA